MKANGKEKNRKVYGRVTYGKSGGPASDVNVTVMDADFIWDDEIGESKTNANGEYKVMYGVDQFRDLIERAPDIYLLIRDAEGRLLTDTRESTVREAGASQEINVQLPEETAPVIEVGGLSVDRRAFAKLQPEDVLRMAEVITKDKDDPEVNRELRELSPELEIEYLRRQYCLTPLTDFLRDAVIVKQWSREVSLRLEEILTGFDEEAAYATYVCPNFSITYQDTGTDQPPTTDTGGNILMPGTGAVVGSTVGGNGVPDYIETLCFWLENALATYTNPPFNLRNPAASGGINVNVTGTSAGFVTAFNQMTIARNLNPDLLAAVPTHELMHCIQYLYEAVGTAGGWNPGMKEGGAVLGEDVVFDTHNRYIVQATSPGTLASPASSLNDYSMRYYLALFLKYITEQQSGQINPSDEPAIGVETYRTLLETFDLSGYNNAAFASAIGQLPWYQSFYEFGYLDPARFDETSSETLLGNFWLACYLKDFGTNTPDRRFDLMEDEENATWDTIFLGSNTVNTLGAVNLTSTNTLNAGGSLTLSSGGGGSVLPFAARFYKINVASGVDTLRINFNAASGFTRPIVQAVLVEPGNVVRDILRTDRTTWARTIANARASVNLDHILIVVAGTDVGGSYTLTVSEVPPAPDVMVTRWHHQAGKHYEIDSFGYAWTWVSPDIWVDNDMDGIADSDVFFNQDNKLFIRLRNQGHAAATNIGVQFYYQSGAGGLSDSAWSPVQNTVFVTQSLSSLSLAPGASGQWSVDWAPLPSGTSNHFCVRAIVTVTGDPNTDNKRCLSNFGNVHAYGGYLDLQLLRRLSENRARARVHIDVIPRTKGKFFVSNFDIGRAEAVDLGRYKEVVDTFRVRRRDKITVIEDQHEHRVGPEFPEQRMCKHTAGLVNLRPDPFGHYPTDPRALPPGLDDVPMITIAHVVDGKPVGGFTWAIREGK